MRIVNRQPRVTADVSACRNTAWRELGRLASFLLLLAVALYLAVGLIVDLTVSRISFEVEGRLFGGLMGRGIARKAVADRRLERADPILAALTADDAVPPLPYRLVAIRQSCPNAFAFPGGTIGVTTGLLDALDQDVALAFVLAHELGHYRNRDHLRGLGRAVGAAAVFGVLFGGEMGMNSVGDVLSFVLQRGYSRRQEERADRFAVELVYRVRGRTDGIERLFELLDSTTAVPDWAYMLATHPSPAARIEALQAYAGELQTQAPQVSDGTADGKPSE